MKNGLAIAFAVCLSLLMFGSFPGVHAFALPNLPEDGFLVPSAEFSYDEQDPGTEARFRRVTCDLLSVSTPLGSLNHAACAAHCIAMNRKYRGGWCSGGVCHCRT